MVCRICFFKKNRGASATKKGYKLVVIVAIFFARGLLSWLLKCITHCISPLLHCQHLGFSLLCDKPRYGSGDAIQTASLLSAIKLPSTNAFTLSSWYVGMKVVLDDKVLEAKKSIVSTFKNTSKVELVFLLVPCPQEVIPHHHQYPRMRYLFLAQ